MGWNVKKIKDIEDEVDQNEKIKRKRWRSSECLIRETKNIYRKAFSETQLLDILGVETFKNGYSYHCISGGDVDSLSFLKVILRQQKLEYLLFSTWCMAADDVMAIGEWLENGTLKKIDAYLGEIFQRSYPMEWKKLNEIFKEYNCGTISVFRNHSKVYAGYGDKYAFAIESSANINTNPRTEQTCITIGEDIYQFYREFYSKIKSFI